MGKYRKEIINGLEIISSEDEEKTEVYEEVLDWINENVVYTKNINTRHSSYGLKHIIENIIGRYVSNYDVKYAFASLGIQGKQDGINYYYPISEKWYKEVKEKSDRIKNN